MVAIDVLRGVALFGVLAVNIYDWLAGPVGAADLAARDATSFLLEDKVWPLFSFVFGLGFAIQLGRMSDRGRSIFWIHARRMLALYGFGVVLIELFAGNPILVRYAVLGMLLFPFARLRANLVLAASLFALAGAVLLRPIGAILAAAGVDTLLSPKSMFYVSAMLEIFTMFLFGLYVGKRRWHQQLEAMRVPLEWAFAIGLSLGIAGTIAARVWADWTVLGSLQRILSNSYRVVGGDLQSLAYAAAIALLATARPEGTILRMLACAGRMPLTNYLTQWLIMRILFDTSPTGIGLSIGPSAGLLVAFAIFIAQVFWSKWWLSRFSIGPAEWLWKSLTYLSMQPIRAVRAM